MLINKQGIYDQSVIANEFNNFFVNVGSNLAAKIPSSEKHFSEYMNQTKEIIPINDLTIKEYKKQIKLVDLMISMLISLNHATMKSFVHYFIFANDQSKLAHFQIK